MKKLPNDEILLSLPRSKHGKKLPGNNVLIKYLKKYLRKWEQWFQTASRFRTGSLKKLKMNIKRRYLEIGIKARERLEYLKHLGGTWFDSQALGSPS